MKDNTKHANQNQQIITFFINSELYGIDIMKLLEIKGVHDITRLPKTPKFLLGVVNLRGVIIPIFDLALKFDMQKKQTDKHIVMFIQLENKTTGILVDAVSDIINADYTELKDAPKMQRGIKDEYLKGLVAHNNSVVAVLDVDQLLGTSIC